MVFIVDKGQKPSRSAKPATGPMSIAQLLLSALGVDETVQDGVRNFFRAVEQIDWIDLFVERLRSSVIRVADEALEDAETSEAAAEKIPTARALFIKHFDRLVRDDALPRDIRYAGMMSIQNAFLIGLIGGQGEIATKVRAEMRRDRTAPALRRRKAEDIQKIIEEEVTRLWERNPQRSGKASATARAILPRVKRRVAELADIPPRWREIQKDDKKLLDVIRKRLPRP
jgi:hypothetical protein